jgi:hypothetical protein
VATYPFSPVILDQRFTHIPRWQDGEQRPDLVVLEMSQVEQLVERRRYTGEVILDREEGTVVVRVSSGGSLDLLNRRTSELAVEDPLDETLLEQQHSPYLVRAHD